MTSPEQTKIVALEGEIAELRTKLDDYKQRIVDYDSKLKQERNDHEATVDAMTKTLEETKSGNEKYIEKLKSDYEATERMITEDSVALKRHNEELMDKLRTAQAQLAEETGKLGNELLDSQLETKASRRETARLTDQLKFSEDQLNDLRTSLNKREEKLREQILELTDSNEALQDEINKLRAKPDKGGAPDDGEKPDKGRKTPPPDTPPKSDLNDFFSAFVNKLNKRVEVPHFHGKAGERPEHHILLCEDYFEDQNIPDRRRPSTFRMTLTGKAREWYEDIEVPDTWEKMKQMFTLHYSTQGRSTKVLHERWRSFKFDPSVGDIESYISDVKQTAKQLGYADKAIVDLLKSSMPDSLYGVLYDKDDLAQIIRMLKDFFASQPKLVADTTPSATPFSSLRVAQTPPQTEPQKQVTFESVNTLQGSVERMEDMITRLNTNLNKQRGPWKPYIAPRGRGRGRSYTPNRPARSFSQDRGERRDSRQRRRGGFRRFRSYSRERQPYRGNPQSRPRVRYDRSPTQRKPRTASRAIDKDKNDRCYKCKEMGHWSGECPLNEQSPSTHLNAYGLDQDPSLYELPMDKASLN